MQTRYVLQAGIGQAELWSLARPIDQVLRDPDTDERTRLLLEEAQRIMSFAKERGLKGMKNYEQYVELDRGAVVWFLAAAEPLELKAKIWDFPLVGSFPYLGWFDAREARMIRDRLRKRGLDVYTRRVNAYSTGGWLDDPILSTMFSPDEDAFRYLTNILLHELTHANILINDQATFNESVASFVGDTMTEEYLSLRFGPDSEQLSLFREELATQHERGARFTEAYKELETLYASGKNAQQKTIEKKRITTALMHELDLSWHPNNASLLGFKTYNTGMVEFATLYKTCGSKWPAFFKAVRAVKPGAFAKAQHDKIGPVITKLGRHCG